MERQAGRWAAAARTARRWSGRCRNNCRSERDDCRRMRCGWRLEALGAAVCAGGELAVAVAGRERRFAFTRLGCALLCTQPITLRLRFVPVS
jgi:hypothetical protein